MAEYVAMISNWFFFHHCARLNMSLLLLFHFTNRKKSNDFLNHYGLHHVQKHEHRTMIQLFQ